MHVRKVLKLTGSVRRKWWSSGSTRRYLNIEFDQKRSIRSCNHQYTESSFAPSSSYPVVYLTVPNWVVDAISCACRRSESLVTNEVIQVFSSSLSREMPARPSATGQI